MVITVNLETEQLQKAEQIARVLRVRSGENISRSEVLRLAIDAFFLTICLTDKTIVIHEESHSDESPTP